MEYQPHAKPDLSLLEGTKVYEYPCGRLTESVDLSWPSLGVTTQQAAEALIGVFGGGQSNRALLTLMKSLEREVSVGGVDGIALVGFEEL